MTNINVEHYEEVNFIKDYSKYVRYLMNTKREKKEIGPYNDPDCEEPFKEPFYSDYLEKFLKGRNRNLLFERSNNRKIKVEDKKSGLTLNLTSDQFGFSAIRFNNSFDKEKFVACNFYKEDYEDIKSKKGFYPYDTYIAFYNGDICDAIKKVAECIYNTRTIGGSFIWPVNKAGKSLYNMSRGCTSYIEDCVDLTLLEINHFYNCCKKGNFDIDKYNNKYGKHDKLLSNKGDRKLIINWLLLFKTFSNYIKFFKFEDFICFNKDNRIIGIIDIFNSKINDSLENDKDNVVLLKDEYNLSVGRMKQLMYNLDDNKSFTDKDKDEIITSVIGNMIDNVSILALRRSDRIEHPDKYNI